MKTINQILKAKIHIGKKALGWVEPDDVVINPATKKGETYREMLVRVGGSDSTRTMSNLNMAKVITYYEKLGWKATRPKKKMTADNWREPRINYIKTMWSQLGALSALDRPDNEGLKAFCNTMMRGNDINFALSYELTNIIEALKSWLRRVTG